MFSFMFRKILRQFFLYQKPTQICVFLIQFHSFLNRNYVSLLRFTENLIYFYIFKQERRQRFVSGVYGWRSVDNQTYLIFNALLRLIEFMQTLRKANGVKSWLYHIATISEGYLFLYFLELFAYFTRPIVSNQRSFEANIYVNA